MTTTPAPALRRVAPGPSSWPFVGNVPDLRAAGDMAAYLDGLEVLSCADARPVALGTMGPSARA